MKRISIERAIEILDPQHRERYSDLSDGMEQVNEACRMGMDALKKQVPKKPVKDKYKHNCCPSCGWIVSYDEGWGEKYVPHCENCGQAIDWSDKE